MKKYYQLPCLSKTGKALEKFWRKANHAAQRADQYAHSMGAAAYIQPVQYFEGGVDFLEFEKEPDLRIWKKRTDLGEVPLYEPNCVVNGRLVILPNDKMRPSDTWCTLYEKKIYAWDEVKAKHSLKYWNALAGVISPLDDEGKAWQKLDEVFAGKFFVGSLQFSYSGIDLTTMKRVPRYVRQAITAERLRVSLPVVSTLDLYTLLQLAPPRGEDLADFSRNLETPTFYIYRDDFYICIQGECVAEELTEITEQLFTFNKNAALREQAQRDA